MGVERTQELCTNSWLKLSLGVFVKKKKFHWNKLKILKIFLIYLYDLNNLPMAGDNTIKHEVLYKA